MANTLTLGGALDVTLVQKKSVAGTLTIAGTALVLQVELNANAGAATFSGAVTFQMGHGVIVGGSFTPVGTVAKGPARTYSGAATFAGALIRQAGKAVNGELIPAGALTPLKLFNVVAAGVLTLSGSLAKAFTMTFTGTLGLAGNLLKRAGQHIAGVLTPTGLLRQGVGEAPCVYTALELANRVYERIDDDGTYYTTEEVFRALNAAQNLWCLLTLCNERTQGFTLPAATTFFTPTTYFTDYIVPLRVTVTSSGARLRPITVHQLDARYGAAWRATVGTPTHYVAMGYDLFAVYPQPAAPLGLTVVYAASPVAVTNFNSLFSDIPAEQQIHLVDFAIWWLRLKEGGEEMASASQYLQRFVEAAEKYGQFVRRRSAGQRYDVVPFDLSSFDRGRLEVTLTQTAVAAKKPRAA